MEEKELKTSKKQRIFISIIAIVMLGSVIGGYAAIVIGGNNAKSSTSNQNKIDPSKVTEYTEALSNAQQEFAAATKSDFDRFIKYRSEIKAYNETSANSEGLKTRDLKSGDGRTLTEKDSDYLAYYVGWCADESIFDSTFDDKSNPTAFTKILDASVGLIEGWQLGVAGMKLNGIRELTIPADLAYKDTTEICGGKNKPLKFLIMPKEKAEPLSGLSAKLEEATLRVQYAQYGIDYDTIKQNSN